ncbi:MAG: UDP-N-acetylglucosamine 1-carboxyvinyltransferase [Candidatus Taylorbacteria bacterium]
MNKESFVIQGQSGVKNLKGSIVINGAKNAALKAMAASILFSDKVELRNIPLNADVFTMVELLKKIGADVEIVKPSSILLNPSTINSTDIDLKLASTMRSSVVLTGPLLSRFGSATFSSPGGCVIGARPIDQFIKGYKTMGATVEENDCIYRIKSINGIGDSIVDFEKRTVGGTETLMMAAVLGNGKVVLNNCAKEPEIVNVAEWLNQCGANIAGVGTDTITVIGTKGVLLKPTVPYIAIPDRIEAGSYLLLGALCAERIEIRNCRPDHMISLIDLLKTSGVPITYDQDSILIENNTVPNSDFKTFNIETREYPGFPTDLQAQIVVMLTQVTGSGMVVENIFEGRFKYVFDLLEMGANINIVDPHTISINGPAPLQNLPEGKVLNAHDIRAGFAIVMAALVAKGTFTVNNIQLIDRGYEKLEERLTALGADIKRVQSR